MKTPIGLPRFRLPCGVKSYVLAGEWQKDHSRGQERCGPIPGLPTVLLATGRSRFADGDIVINTLPLRQAAIAGAAMLFGLQSALATETPTTQDLVHATASGSYLAARHAGTERDSATAAAYYLNVL
jgi:hypothetical protein